MNGRDYPLLPLGTNLSRPLPGIAVEDIVKHYVECSRFSVVESGKRLTKE